MVYALTQDIQARMSRALSDEEIEICTNLLEDAGVIIDAAAPTASNDAKRVVSIRMVQRALGDGQDLGVPLGASQSTVSALGYSQSWTISNGSAGELYLGKQDKQILGCGNRIGSASPLEGLT